MGSRHQVTAGKGIVRDMVRMDKRGNFVSVDYLDRFALESVLGWRLNLNRRFQT